jgi:subtilisin family serine protease
MQRCEPAERGWRFEAYEERLALSVDSVADCWPLLDVDQAIEPSSAFVTPLAAEGHGWFDVAEARREFGLGGSRQTVAIIDSGIAYDHIALGGGLGKAYRVVGGWDFAENDADPYDDGPAGFHGTHIAGIVGAGDSRYPGVAPEVDLVALRVFDDAGNSDLGWIEQALRWVHEHRSAFENPITTVNLSLGTPGNVSSQTAWATLDDELRQLAADGIFIAAAAGNSFLTQKTTGLAYPAASQYVTPVASVDASGALSKFSQRDGRVLAAPGERIKSTLPDHFYGGDGVKNDWGAASGTSMAAPYVAGASVLVREAMENLGFVGVNQQSIYDLFRRTADTVYDAATGANYYRLNVMRSLEALVGADDYGSSVEGARSLGSLAATVQVSGTIGRVSDQDFFQFTAARSGQVTLTLSGTVQLGVHWVQPAGGQVDGGKLILDVMAGNTYTVAVAGGGTTIGKYGVEIRLVEATVRSPVSVLGSTATITGSDGNDAFRWQAGGRHIEVNGASFPLAGATQIVLDGGRGDDSLVVVGGRGAETVKMWPGRAEIVGRGHQLEATAVERVHFEGAGDDSVVLFDSEGNDTFEAMDGRTRLAGRGYEHIVEGAGSIVAVASAGFDLAHFTGSAGNDALVVSVGTRTFYSGKRTQRTEGFEQAVFSGGGGFDSVEFYTSSRTGRLEGRGNRGLIADTVFATQFAEVESLLAIVRTSHRLRTDLAAVEFVFQKIGRA